MITRRKTLKLLAVAASTGCQHVSAEESLPADPIPHFMKWPATDEVAKKLNQFRQEASCSLGKILLRHMLLIRPDANKDPEIIQTFPEKDEEFEVQLCIAFRLTCVPNAGKHWVTSTLTGPDLELLVSKNLPAKDAPAEEVQNFWFQDVENIESNPQPSAGARPHLALELGLTKLSKFATEKEESQPNSWRVICFTGVWFSIKVEDKKMTMLKPVLTAPKQEVAVKYFDYTIPEAP